MKHQILFSGKNKTKFNLTSVEFSKGCKGYGAVIRVFTVCHSTKYVF